MKSLNVQRMIFGFCLLIVYATLISMIALGTVKEDTSAGLKELIGGLLVITGNFAQWCFSDKGNNKDDGGNG